MNSLPVTYVSRILRKFGPYFALTVLVPGGSLIAIFLWFFRRKFESA
jgi:hypothetical protein